MGYDPDHGTLHELTPEFMESLSLEKRKQVEAEWAKFREGDIVAVRQQQDIAKPFIAKFRIAEISNNRMVLIAIGA
jgi:hypothetical protein